MSEIFILAFAKHVTIFIKMLYRHYIDHTLSDNKNNQYYYRVASCNKINEHSP